MGMFDNNNFSNAHNLPNSFPPAPPQVPLRALPSTVKPPNQLPPNQVRAVLHQVSPDDNNPTMCSVLINNRMPPRPGFTLPAGIGKVYKAGSTVLFTTSAPTPISTGSQTITPLSLGGVATGKIEVGNTIVVDTVASGVQETITVTAVNYTSGTFTAIFAHAHTGTYQVPLVATVAAPGPFYNDPATNEGGSYVAVDTSLMSVIQILQGVSKTYPSSAATLVSSHVHTGSVDANGNPLPQPVNLREETQNTVGTGQLPNLVPPAPVVERLYVAGDLNPKAAHVTPHETVTGFLTDFGVDCWVNNVPQDSNVNRVAWSIRKTSAPQVPSLVHFAQGLTSTSSGFIARFDSSGTYQPTAGNLVVFVLSEDMTPPTGWSGSSSISLRCMIYKVWGSGDNTTSVISGSHVAYTAYEFSGVNPSTPIAAQSTLAFTSGTTGTIPIVTVSGSGQYGLLYVTTDSFGGLYDPTPTTPTFTNGFTYDGTAAVNYVGPGGPDTGTVFSAHLSPVPIGSISSTVTLGSEFIGQSWTGVIILLNPAGGNGPGPWATYEYTYLSGLPNPPAEQQLFGGYGQVVKGVEYDMGVSYFTTGDVQGPISIFASAYSDGPLDGLVTSGSNRWIDSGNSAAVFSGTKAASNPNAAFDFIDGVHCYILKGSASDGSNPFIVDGHNTNQCWWLCQSVKVNQGEVWTVSAYIDTTQSTGGSTGGPFVAITDYVHGGGSGDSYTTIYNKQKQSALTQGRVSCTFTIPSGVTEIGAICHSDGADPVFLVMSQPMLQQSDTPTGYTPGSPISSDGSVRASTSVSRTLVHNVGDSASTIPSSPTTTSGATTPTSGGSAPAYDQQQQGSLRITQDGNLYQQTGATPTSPNWTLIGGSSFPGYEVIFAAQIY